MYLLRRAAVRAASQQTSRQLCTLRSSFTQRNTILQSTKPALCRSFHQSRIWRIEEDKKDAEVVAEEAKAESIESAEVAEHAAAAAEEAATDAAAATAEPAVQEAQEVAEGESSIAADAASSAAASAAAASTAAPPEPRQHERLNPFAGSRGSGGNVPFGTPSRILYVGNLFFEVTAAQLEAEFSSIGRVVNSRVVTDARGLSKGFGYIEFAEQSMADRAVQELDQKAFQGRRMAVQYHIPRERRPSPMRGGAGGASGPAPPSKTLFIGNLSYQMSDKDLNDLFREIRDVLDVRVAIDRRSGQPRGFAHADFIDIQSATRAKEVLSSKTIYGRQLRVDFSNVASQDRRS